MAVTLETLPDELLQAILQYLDARSVVALGQTARRFVDSSNEPLIWKEFCQRDFRLWDFRQKYRDTLNDPSFQFWQNLYATRCRTARSTKSTIDTIIANPVGRCQRLTDIADSGYSTKEVLLQLYNDANSSKNHLAQKYWSHLAIGCLHRSMALEQWMRIRFCSDIINPTEHALAGLDMFILDESEEGDVDDIFDRLDSYVVSVRNAYPDMDERSPRDKATLVAEHLRSKGWVGIAEERPYHSLDNMFLGVSLRSRHRNSLPLISAVIYCYVCRQFNIRAQPCSFPFHVHAVIQAPPGQDLDGQPLPASHIATEEPHPTTHLYMDPFKTTQSLSISTLESQLRFISPSATRAEIIKYLSPATPRDLLIRSAHNILNSTSQHIPTLDEPIPISAAIYAALFAMVMFPTHPATLQSNIHELTSHLMHYFDHDISIFENYVVPLTTSLPDNIAYRNFALGLKMKDRERPIPKPRSAEENKGVTYKVGQVFRHRHRGYLAVIHGWDPACQSDEIWIRRNEVDRLPKGRAQPFYNVLVDDQSIRYVAQENIVLLTDQELSEHDNNSFPIEIGKWFSRYDKDRGVFVSNVKHEYPED